MKISIITPVYNSERYLKKLYDSIVNQTYQNFEWILVDDGSTDSSYQTMKELKTKNDKIKIYTKHNEGPGMTRKYGFEKSVGELLFFIDSDDWLPDKNVFQNIVAVFNDFEPDILIFDRIVIKNNQETIITPFSCPIAKGLHSITDMAQSTIRGGLGLKVFISQKMKSDYFKAGNNYEDFYTTYYYLDHCQNFYYENNSFYCINRLEENNSLTKTNGIDKFQQALYNMIEVYQLSKQLEIKTSISAIMLELYMQYFYDRLHFHYSKEDLVQIKPNIRQIKEIIRKHKLSMQYCSIKKKIIYYIFLKRR